MSGRGVGATISIMALLVFGIVAMFGWSDRSATASTDARHGALHIHCPPGSHGQPRYATFGKALGYKSQDAVGSIGSPRAVQDRGLTGSRRSP